jgi:outer membrane autotransporter protein
LGTIALATTSVQTTKIGIRLAALRRGATGASASGLALNIDGQSLPLGALTGMIPSGERGGGASADRSGFLSRLGFFANGQGNFGNQDATSREPGFDFHTAGVTLGADYRLTDQVLLGMAFGYLRTKSDFDASAGNSTVNGYSLSAYGSYYILDKLYVDGIATFGWNDYSTDRNIPNVNATANGSTDGTQFAISVSTGYNFNAGAFTFGPTGRVDYVQVHIDGYQETGANPFNLNIRSQNPASVTTALGGQATYAISTQWAVLMPLVRFEWLHEYKDGSRTVTATVVADPATGVSVQTNNPDRDYFNLGAGLSATFRHGVSGFFNYETVLGRDNFTSNAFTAGVRFEF